MKSAEEQPVLLRVLVGSHAHGLARPDSDYDYREVFAIPTSEMLSLGRQQLKYAWMAQNKHTDDEGGEEIAQFLHLCSKGAPNVVEMLFAPQDDEWVRTVEMEPATVREIGRSVLSRKAVQDGVTGYAMNSFRKLDSDPGKWKAGMLRVLYQGQELLLTGTIAHGLSIVGRPWEANVRAARANEMTDSGRRSTSRTRSSPPSRISQARYRSRRTGSRPTNGCSHSDGRCGDHARSAIRRPPRMERQRAHTR